MANAASMQVLNQAFANANNALLGIMNNRLRKEALDSDNDYRNKIYALREREAQRRAQENAMQDVFWYDSLLRQNPDSARAYASMSGLDKRYDPVALGALATRASALKREQDLNGIYSNIRNMLDQNRRAQHENYIQDRDYNLEKSKVDAQKRRAEAGIMNAIARYSPQAAIEYGKSVGILPNTGANFAGDIGESETKSDLTGDIAELQNLNRSLDGWYWTENGRRTDEERRNLIASRVAPKIKTPEMLEAYVKAGLIDANSAKIIADLNNF